MKVRNVNPLGAVSVRDLNFQDVEANEVIEVDDDLGAKLLEQIGNWEPVGAEAKAVAKAQAADTPDAEPEETNN